MPRHTLPQPQALQDRTRSFGRPVPSAFSLIAQAGATGSSVGHRVHGVPARTHAVSEINARFQCGGGQRSYHRQRTAQHHSAAKQIVHRYFRRLGHWPHTLPQAVRPRRAHVRIVFSGTQAFGPESEYGIRRPERPPRMVAARLLSSVSRHPERRDASGRGHGILFRRGPGDTKFKAGPCSTFLMALFYAPPNVNRPYSAQS